MLRSIFLILFLFSSLSLAGEPNCEAEVRNLLNLHIALQQDPSRLSSLITTTAGAVGAAVGVAPVLAAENAANRAARVEFESNRRQLNSDIHRLELQIQRLTPPSTVTAEIERVNSSFETYARNQGLRVTNFTQVMRPHLSDIDALLAEQGRGATRLSFENARLIVGNISIFNRTPLSAMQERALTNLVIQYAEGQKRLAPFHAQRVELLRRLSVSHGVRSLKSDITPTTRARVRSRIAMGAGGAIFGILAERAVSREMLRRECSDYGVENLIGYFTTSVADMMASGQNRCFLKTSGAISLLDNPREITNVCENYPGIIEALQNSLYLTSQMSLESLNQKNNYLDGSTLDCTPESDQPHLNFDIDGTPFRVWYNSQGYRFEFDQQTPSQRGMHSGEVVFGSDLMPTFNDTSHSRLRVNMRDATDYSTLANEFIHYNRAAQEPTRHRRYMYGAALMSGSTLFQQWQTTCLGQGASGPEGSPDSVN